MTNTGSVIAIRDQGGTATIRLNRPDHLNSLDANTKSQLLAALQEAGSDPEIRAVVITGTDRAFCAGQDLGEAVSMPAGTQLGDAVRESYNPIVRAIATMPKPVIAAINGSAAGAGLSLALACDIRVAAKSANFTTAFAHIALSCDTGISWTLPRVVGRAKALDLLFRPRVIDSAEALNIGLISQVVADEAFADTVHSIAASLSAGPTLALASIKSAVNHASESTLDDALEFEATQMTLTGATSDHRSAVEAFLAKRKPTFSGRGDISGAPAPCTA